MQCAADTRKSTSRFTAEWRSAFTSVAAVLCCKVGVSRKDLGGESDNMPRMWVWTVGVLEDTFHLVATSSWRTGKRTMEKEPERSRKQNHHRPGVSDGTDLKTYVLQEDEKEKPEVRLNMLTAAVS